MRVTGIGLRGLFPDGERKGGPASFVEELVVRKELSDNYCMYVPGGAYDSLAGASAWAQATLTAHAGDKRDAIYTLEQFERGATHEALWNAGQMELIHRGKLGGWMRVSGWHGRPLQPGTQSLTPPPPLSHTLLGQMYWGE